MLKRLWLNTVPEFSDQLLRPLETPARRQIYFPSLCYPWPHTHIHTLSHTPHSPVCNGFVLERTKRRVRFSPPLHSAALLEPRPELLLTSRTAADHNPATSITGYTTHFHPTGC